MQPSHPTPPFARPAAPLPEASEAPTVPTSSAAPPNRRPPQVRWRRVLAVIGATAGVFIGALGIAVLLAGSVLHGLDRLPPQISAVAISLGSTIAVLSTVSNTRLAHAVWDRLTTLMGRRLTALTIVCAVLVVTLLLAQVLFSSGVRPASLGGGSLSASATQTAQAARTVQPTVPPTPSASPSPSPSVSPSAGPATPTTSPGQGGGGGGAPTATWPFADVTPIYASTLASSDNHWTVHDSTVNDPDYRCYYAPDGTYHSWWQNQRATPCTENVIMRGTVAWEVQAQLLTGDGYNIYLDTDTTNYNFGYFLQMSTGGNFQFIQRVSGHDTPMPGGSGFFPLTLKQRNTIGLIARNGVIQLWINRNLVFTTPPNSYTPISGYLALAAAAFTPTGVPEVSFSNASVWDA